MTDDVLHLCVVEAAVLATEIGKGWNLVKEVVCDGDEDEYTDGVHPDDNDGDDVGVSIARLLEGRHWAWQRLLVDVGIQPSENTEESGHDIDAEDGANQLPRWKSGRTTGHEDEPVLGQSNFEEENFLNVTPVLHDTARWQVEGTADDPGGEGKLNTENDGDDPDLWELPFDRALLRMSVVVGDGDSGQISEEGDEDDELGGNGLVDDDHGSDQVDFQMQAESDTVLNVCLHPLEDLSCGLDGENNGGETWGKEDDIGSGLGGLGGTLDGNTAVRLLERWSIVDTVTSHGRQVTTLLQHLDDLVLVLWEDLGETVGTLDEIVLGSAGETTVDELLGVVDLGTEGKHLARLLGNGNSVTSKHLHGNTELLGLNDGLSGILTWRVEHGKHTEEDPWLVVLLVENGLWCTLGAGEAVAAECADGGDTLGDGVERNEFLGLPVVLEDITSLGVALEVDILALSDVWLADRELVGSESTGLVGAENIDTGKRLDGSELLDDRLLLGEVGGTDSQGGGGDDRQTDRHTDNEQDQDVLEEGVVRVLWGSDLEVAEETTDPGSENPEHDQDEQSGTDGVHDSLEVTLVLGTLHERGSATDEGEAGRSSSNGVGLATLATSSVVDDIAHVLVHSERFTGDGRLIGSDNGVALVLDPLTLVALSIFGTGWILFWVESVLFAKLLVLLEVLRVVVIADETGVGRDGLTFLDDDDVAWNDFASLDILFLSVANDGRLHGNVALEFRNNICGLLFLVPTDDGVEQQNSDNDAEIDPVTKTGSEEDSEFHDCQELATAA
ncbi:hypothetical protein AC579_2498 [Pseudocercospora musae]|uniref:Uncharacterized protein n=1 Tax=Pseudocercospora musae TaxID=113226 RepID=A0A139IF60_9PEZI|nr:hypothetical protein AC579_2498 [Pseudocercospora musae]